MTIIKIDHQEWIEFNYISNLNSKEREKRELDKEVLKIHECNYFSICSDNELKRNQQCVRYPPISNLINDILQIN